MASPFFDDVVFPLHVSRGSFGGPDWPAEIIGLANGQEERNTPVSLPLRRYDAKYGVRYKSEIHEILSLYYACHGRLTGFRLRDWADYRSGPSDQLPSATDQSLGVGDGIQKSFQLAKRYEFAGHGFIRPIQKPESGTILVAIDGAATTSGFTINHATGLVTFASAPTSGKVLTWGGQFHVPVRFDCALDQTTWEGPMESIPTIALKEVRP